MKQIAFGVHLPDRCDICNNSVENTLTDAITVITSLFGFKHYGSAKGSFIQKSVLLMYHLSMYQMQVKTFYQFHIACLFVPLKQYHWLF